MSKKSEQSLIDKLKKLKQYADIKPNDRDIKAIFDKTQAAK